MWLQKKEDKKNYFRYSAIFTAAERASLRVSLMDMGHLQLPATNKPGCEVSLSLTWGLIVVAKP